MSEDEQKILALFQQRNNAMVNKDTKTLNSLLDDDAVIIHMSGYEQSKQEWFNQIENEEMKYHKIMPGNIKITIDGNLAVLSCDVKIDARIYGTRNTWSMKSEIHFEKRRDDWHSVNSPKPISN